MIFFLCHIDAWDFFKYKFQTLIKFLKNDWTKIRYIDHFKNDKYW